MTEFAVEQGFAADECLRGTGLSVAGLAAPELVVSREQELAVIANLCSALDRPGLGIEVGRRYHVTTHGIWGYALISSPTLQAAIDLGLRYLDLSFSYCQITAQHEGDEVALVVDPGPAPPSHRTFVAERDIGIIDALRGELVGPLVPLDRVQLPHRSPGHEVAERLRALVNADIQFGAPRYAACFSRSSVELPLPLANPHTAAMAEQQCRELLERSETHTGLTGQVRNVLLGNPARPPTAEQVAASLFLAPRTFRRRLIEEGTSYRSLLDEVRMQVAQDLLGQTRLSVAEVAERLGYAETASFTHAFRRWTGSAPRGFRASAH